MMKCPRESLHAIVASAGDTLLPAFAARNSFAKRSCQAVRPVEQSNEKLPFASRSPFR